MEVFNKHQQGSTKVILFPDDREIPDDAVDTLQVKLRWSLRCLLRFVLCKNIEAAEFQIGRYKDWVGLHRNGFPNPVLQQNRLTLAKSPQPR